MSTNRLAEKLEMSKTEMSAFLTSDEQTFKQMGNSNYCAELRLEKKDSSRPDKKAGTEKEFARQ